MSTTTTTTTTLFLLVLLPLLVSYAHHLRLADAIGKACTSIASRDHSIPYDFCTATLAKATSADPGDMAEAAADRAIDGIYTIQNDVFDAERRLRGSAAAIGRYSECQDSFEAVRHELLSAEDEIYDGQKPYGFAVRHLRTALRDLRSAQGTCEKQLVDLNPLSAVSKQVETAIKIAEKVLGG